MTDALAKQPVVTQPGMNTRVDAEVQGGVTEAEGPQLLSWDSRARRWVVVYIPLVVVSTLCAALFMDNLTHVSNDRRGMRDVSRDGHTWIMSFLYIGTFGSFIGFSFAFGQVLQVQFADQFDTAVKAASLTFLRVHAGAGQ